MIMAQFPFQIERLQTYILIPVASEYILIGASTIQFRKYACNSLANNKCFYEKDSRDSVYVVIFWLQ